MLRVTYEIIPYGQEDHPNRRVIATQVLGLQKNESGLGHYTSRLINDGEFPPKNEVVALTNHRDTGAYHLVRKALERHLGLS